MRDIIPYENKYPLDKRTDDEILEQRRGCFIDFVTLDRMFNKMTREQKGDFLESVREYFKSDTVPEESVVGERVCSAFDIFQPLEVSNRAKYVQKCRRQRHNALKKNRKKADADQDEEDSHGYPQQAMADDIDKDIEIEINTDIVKDEGEGVAIATLRENPSASFNPITTSDDIQPLLMIDNLSEEVFKAANIDKDNVTEIVQYYCRKYRQRFSKSCPAINEDFAKRLPSEIAVLIDKESGEYLIDTDKWEHNSQDYIEWYESMIDKYFDTKFNDGCNYSLQHFFSGNIRALRFREVGRETVEL